MQSTGAVGYSFVLYGSEGTLLLERQTELGLLPGILTRVGSVIIRLRSIASSRPIRPEAAP